MFEFIKVKKNYYKLASEAYAAEDWEIAQKYIKKAIRQSPKNPHFLLLLANILYIKEDYAAAEEIYQKILSVDSCNQAAIINCCDIFIMQKKYRQAQEYIDKLGSITKADFMRGKLAFAKENYVIAERILSQYVNSNDADFWEHNLLSQAAQKNGNFKLALTSALSAVEKSDGDDSQHLNLAYAIYEIALEKGIDFVLPTLKRWYQKYPHNHIVKHSINSFFHNSDSLRSEAQYIETVFDNFADTFEATLHELNYTAPQKIAEEIKERFADLPSKKMRILDAGCGTGLCALEVDSLFDKYQLDGVDLSANMLKLAKQKKLYSQLRQADIEIDFFEHKNTYDIILAADVLTYFGDLKNIFTGACFALQKNGIFVFSISKNSTSSDTWTQHLSGRFLHGENYIKNLLYSSGFSDVKFAPCILRKEGEKDVAGWVISAIKKVP